MGTEEIVQALPGSLVLHTTDGRVVVVSVGDAQTCSRDAYLRSRFAAVMMQLERLLTVEYYNRSV